MTRIGYALSSEEHGPRDLVTFARRAEAGYDHVYIHQIGPDQESFFDFYERQILPKLR